jgi:ribonuclease I
MSIQKLELKIRKMIKESSSEKWPKASRSKELVAMDKATDCDLNDILKKDWKKLTIDKLEMSCNKSECKISSMNDLLVWLNKNLKKDNCSIDILDDKGKCINDIASFAFTFENSAGSPVKSKLNIHLK